MSPLIQTAAWGVNQLPKQPACNRYVCTSEAFRDTFNFLLRDTHRRLTSLIVPSWTFCIAPLRVREKCLMCRHNQFCIIYQLRVENIPQAATSSNYLSTPPPWSFSHRPRVPLHLSLSQLSHSPESTLVPRSRW